jgi:hypothetical protein
MGHPSDIYIGNSINRLATIASLSGLDRIGAEPPVSPPGLSPKDFFATFAKYLGGLCGKRLFFEQKL